MVTYCDNYLNAKCVYGAVCFFLGSWFALVLMQTCAFPIPHPQTSIQWLGESRFCSGVCTRAHLILKILGDSAVIGRVIDAFVEEEMIYLNLLG